MQRRYAVALFIDHDGNNPVQDYMFDAKNITDLNVLINVIERLSYVGQDLLDTNMAKRIEGPICELRKDRHRIMYAKFGRRFVLFSGFLKKTRKTPRKEIQLAQERYEEFTDTGNCKEVTFPSQ